MTSSRTQDTGLSTGSSAPGQEQHVSLWDVYRFAYRVAFRSLSWSKRANILRLLLEPCNYWRNVEVPATLDRLDVKPKEKVLDIGSPKLPSLFLWYCLRAEVYATDLFPYFFDEYSEYFKHLHQPDSRYHIEKQDARCLCYPDSYFDKVYAISVLEHIADDGDSRSMREIFRVLKPGGSCCLTVPFAEHYRESTIDREIYYKQPINGEPVFFERHYDMQTLHARLVEPSGLNVAAVEYYGERWLPYERLYESMPRILKIVVAPLGPLFSKFLLHAVDPQCNSPIKMALINLVKRREEL